MAKKMLFLDFGGCIDAPGIHPRNVYWDHFSSFYLEKGIDRERFQEAYSKADLQMMTSGEAAAMGLGEFNRYNIGLIDQHFKSTKSGVSELENIADQMTRQISIWIKESRLHLREIRNKTEMGIISNFTGNLSVILKEFDLNSLFSSVTESFYERVSKPDPAIFLAALGKHGLSPDQAIYVGDNFKNDIQPAKELGFWTVHFMAKGETSGEAKSNLANAHIHSLGEIHSML